jgi:hypothetical protein
LPVGILSLQNLVFFVLLKCEFADNNGALARRVAA